MLCGRFCSADAAKTVDVGERIDAEVGGDEFTSSEEL